MTPKQERFIAEYLVDLNGTQAAIRSGYSPKTAQEQASRLLSNAMVAAEIQKRQAVRLKGIAATAERTMLEMQRLAFSDVRRLFTDWGALKPVHELSDDDAACLASLEVLKKNLFAGDRKVDTIHKLRMWDKLKALEMLAKHFGLLEDKVIHSGTVTIEVKTPW